MEHRFVRRTFVVVFLVGFFSVIASLPGSAQAAPQTVADVASVEADATSAASSLPDAPQASPSASAPQTASVPQASADGGLYTGQQTKRILFIVPNFRAASVDAKLPPMTAKEEVKLVLQDSFDYSSFVYVGITAGVAQWQKSYPAFHQGAAGYGRYYWHAFADSVGENAFTEFIIPYATRQDPRYYTLGRGGFRKRLVYSASRLVICRDNNAKETFNYSEIVGSGASAGISNLYYPSAYTSWTKTGQKWVTQVGIDGLGNIAKEFWPDINAHVFKNAF
jgi:hypothetical protein